MNTQNAVTQPTETQMIQYLRNSGLELFYIAPGQHSSKAAKNTTAQLTDAELKAVESGKGRVGLRLDTPNYKMVEICHVPNETDSLTSVALLPKPAVQIWNGETECISDLYFIDETMPNMQVKDFYGDLWLAVRGSYNDPFAHTVLPGGVAKREFDYLHPRLHMHNSHIPTRGLEWQLKCAAVTELYSCLINCGTDVFYLMQYLVLNGVDFSTVMTMMNSILRRHWTLQFTEAKLRPIYMNLQHTRTKDFGYDGMNIRFPGGEVADSLDRMLGFTPPKCLPEV